MRITAALILLPLALAQAAAPLSHARHRRHHAALAARQEGNAQQPDAMSFNGGRGGRDDSPSDPPSSSEQPTPEPSSDDAEPTSVPTSSVVSQPPQSTTQPPVESQKPRPPGKGSKDEPSSTSSAWTTESSVLPSSSPSSSITPSSSSSVVPVVIPSSSSSLTSASPVSVPLVAQSSATPLVVTARPSSTVSSRASSTTSAKTTGSAAASNSGNKSNGLPKGAIIAIIVGAVLVGIAILGSVLYRKFKEGHDRIDRRMQPIDFTPGIADDDFVEKTLQRADSDEARQRQQFVADLDHSNGLVGDLNHDFTAGPGYGGYNAYHYDAPCNNGGYPQQGYGGQPQYYGEFDAPSQDDGYNNVQRAANPNAGQGGYQFNDFSVTGRPTGGAGGDAGPYAQAAAFR